MQDQNAPLLPVRWLHRCAALRAGRRRRQLERERCAAVLLHELANPLGLLLDEGVQRHLAGLDHVQRLLPHRRGAGVGDGRGTASMSVKAASEARMARPFFTR